METPEHQLANLSPDQRRLVRQLEPPAFVRTLQDHQGEHGGILACCGEGL